MQQPCYECGVDSSYLVAGVDGNFIMLENGVPSCIEHISSAGLSAYIKAKDVSAEIWKVEDVSMHTADEIADSRSGKLTGTLDGDLTSKVMSTSIREKQIKEGTIDSDVTEEDSYNFHRQFYD